MALPLVPRLECVVTTTLEMLEATLRHLQLDGFPEDVPTEKRERIDLVYRLCSLAYSILDEDPEEGRTIESVREIAYMLWGSGW